METQEQANKNTIYHKCATISVLAIPIAFAANFALVSALPLLGTAITLVGLLSGIIALFGIRKHGKKRILTKSLIGISIPLIQVALSFMLVPSVSEVRKEFERSRSENSKLEIVQSAHSWGIESLERVTQGFPVEIKLYLQNRSDERINTRVAFRVELNDSGIEEGFLRHLIAIIGKEELLNDDGKKERFAAIKRYIERGEKLPDDSEYEPIKEDGDIVFSTLVYHDVDLEAKETKKLFLEADIPTAYRGFLLSVNPAEPVGVDYD